MKDEIIEIIQQFTYGNISIEQAAEEIDGAYDAYYEKQIKELKELEYNLFSLLRPKIYLDGNSWCVHYGEDFPEGITGFGKTPYLAVLDWTAEWNKQALKK